MKIDGQGRASILSPSEFDLLISNAPCMRSRALFSVMRFTGSRISESLQLRWVAVQDAQLIFMKRTTKTKKTREVLLHERLIKELKIYRDYWVKRYGKEPASGDLLFAGRFSLREPLTRQWGHKAWRKAIKNAGLKAGTSCHTPRRSFCTQLHEKGVPLKTIAAYSGHSSLDQLSQYVDVGLKEKVRALKALD